QSQYQAVIGNIKPARVPLLEISDVVPDFVITAPYLLLGLHAEGYQPDQYTDAVAIAVAAKQFPDGSWKTWGPRPPMEFSEITSTALAVRMLDVYGPKSRKAEFDKRIASAREYFKHVTPRTNEEMAMRLLGLKWSGADQSSIRNAAAELTRSQRHDGGWGARWR